MVIAAIVEEVVAEGSAATTFPLSLCSWCWSQEQPEPSWCSCWTQVPCSASLLSCSSGSG